MLERVVKESWTLEDVEELRRGLSPLKHNTTPFYELCKAWVAQSEDGRRTSKAIGETSELPTKSMPFGKSDYGHSFNMDKVLASLSEEEMLARVVCILCVDIHHQATITDV